MQWLYWAVPPALLFGWLFCWFENNALVTSVFQLPARGLARELRVVQLSDLHSKRFGRENRRLLNAVRRAAPGLILFTGDTFDSSGLGREGTLRFLEKCAGLAPVVFIGGNHERRLPDREELFRRMREIPGLTLLENTLVTLTAEGQAVSLLGLDEDQGSYEAYVQRARGKYAYQDNRALFLALEEAPGLRLLLSHYPENFALIGENSYENHAFDCMFAGHAHGGQFRLPWVGGLYAPGQGIFPRYTAGLHGKRPYLLISRGLGRSSFYLRLFNRPQLIVAVFRTQKEKTA